MIKTQIQFKELAQAMNGKIPEPLDKDMGVEQVERGSVLEFDPGIFLVDQSLYQEGIYDPEKNREPRESRNDAYQ